MKYDHIVKLGGVYYPAGADVPDEVTRVNDIPSEETVSDEDITFETDAVDGKAKRGRPRK